MDSVLDQLAPGGTFVSFYQGAGWRERHMQVVESQQCYQLFRHEISIQGVLILATESDFVLRGSTWKALSKRRMTTKQGDYFRIVK